MPKTLRLASNLKLSDEAVMRQVAWLGKTGMGKTHGCGKFVEGLRGMGAQVVVLDSVGNWYGLRIGADGKSKGLDIAVFGGRNGDIPLEHTAGRLVARVVVERGISVVLDVSRFRPAQRDRFCYEFAEELFELKKEDDSPLHLVIEEAQRVIPEKLRKGQQALKGAFEDVCKIGRNFGIGWSLITQRPQAVDKEVLNQADPLFVFMTSGKHERKAILDWIDEKGVDGEVLKGLSKLKRGTCCFWSPEWMGVLKKVRIEKKRTYDASATPKLGQKRRNPKPLAKRDLKKLRDEMKEMVERVEGNDPRKLQQRIRALKAELAKKPGARVEQKRVEVPVLSKGDLRRLESLYEKLHKLAAKHGVVSKAAEAARDEIRQLVERASKPLLTSSSPSPQPAPRAVAPRPNMATRPAGIVTELPQYDGKTIRAGAKRMLVAMAVMGRPLTRTQLSLLAKVRTTGGTFGTYLSDLTTSGLAYEGNDKLVVITEEGRGFLGTVPYLDTSPEGIATYFKSKLRAGVQRMLTALMGIYPEGMTRAELSEACEVRTTGGTFGTYLSNLTTAHLAKIQDGMIYAHEDLYLGQR